MTVAVTISKKLILIGALLFGSALHADCGELLLRFSNQNLPAYGAMPEEVLAAVGRRAPDVDLPALLRELRIEHARFGSRFRVTGWGERTLVVERPDWSTPQREERYLKRFAFALFREKQRLLRFSTPERYVRELSNLGTRLERFLPGVEAPKFNYVTYTLRSLIGFMPKNRLWPTKPARLGFHFALSRTFAGLYLAAFGFFLDDIPKAVHAVETLVELQEVMFKVGSQLQEGIVFDPRDERRELIQRYEEKIRALEEELAHHEGDLESLRQRIERFKEIIRGLEADLANS